MFCQSLSFVTGVTRQEVSPVCLPSSGSATWSVSSTLSPCFSFLFIECNGLTTWSLESSVNQQSARYRLYTQIRIIQGDYLQRDGQEVGKVQRTEKPQENCHLGKRQEDRGSYRTEGRRVARATVRWAAAPSQGTVSARWPPCRKGWISLSCPSLDLLLAEPNQEPKSTSIFQGRKRLEKDRE